MRIISIFSYQDVLLECQQQRTASASSASRKLATCCCTDPGASQLKTAWASKQRALCCSFRQGKTLGSSDQANLTWIQKQSHHNNCFMSYLGVDIHFECMWSACDCLGWVIFCMLDQNTTRSWIAWEGQFQYLSPLSPPRQRTSMMSCILQSPQQRHWWDTLPRQLTSTKPSLLQFL